MVANFYKKREITGFFNMLSKTNVPGFDGFVWWTGIVEDRKDPEKLSRVQVRMFVHHVDDKALIPTEKLFWAIPVYPSNNSNQTYCVKEGDAVFGFFIDGKDAQQPYIFGRFPDRPEKQYPASKGFSDPGTSMGDRPVEVASRFMIDGEGLRYSDAGPRRYPDPLKEQTNSRFARNENLDKTPLMFVKENIIKNIPKAFGGEWNEVDPDYAAVYPYNDSKQSESGHFVDVDDTRRKERITQMHRTGTMQEIRHTGSIHRKDMKHAYQLVHGTKLTNVRGNVWTTVERVTRFKAKGHTYVEINADIDMGVARDFNLDVGLSGGGKLTVKCLKVSIQALEQLELKAPIIKMVGTVQAEKIIADNFVGGFIGQLVGPASTAVIAGDTGSVPTPIVIPVTPKVSVDVKAFDLIDKPEAPWDENSTSDKKDDKQSELDALLAKITAPTGGGRGVCWTYTMPDGTTGSLHTHHATGPGEVLNYFKLLGATSATQDEQCAGSPVNHQL